MSEEAASSGHRRLRVWLCLLGLFVGLVLTCLAAGWFWLSYTGDIEAIKAEAQAAGISVQSEPKKITDPLRLARARSIDAAARAIKVEGAGQYIYWDGRKVSYEFRVVHQAISSQAVCDVAQGIIDLGSDPIVVSPNDRRVAVQGWGRLLNNRMLIAEGQELDLCLAANRTRIDMLLGHEPLSWGWGDFQEMCSLLPHCLVDRPEQVHPLADWLDTKADWFLADFPNLVHQYLLQDCQRLRHGEQTLKELGANWSGWLINLSDWLQSGVAVEIAMRKERAGILRAELSWQRFLNSHPGEPRLWMDEADRRTAAIASISSWLGTVTHQQVLGIQSSWILRRLMGNVLYARLLSAEVRGSPWPVDLCDRAGSPLRRWERDGRLIGAYSVGPDGIDNGGDKQKDILFRLRLDPPPSLSIP